MNKYLFKAKRLDNGEWVQGVPFEIEGKQVILINDNENYLSVHYLEENMWNAEIYAIEVEPSTICQCTDLKDKNGTLVYENDTVKCGNKLTVKVNREFARWWAKGKIEEYIYRCCKKTCCESEIEVIGNIFDDFERACRK